jgi:hypothetical protein
MMPSQVDDSRLLQPRPEPNRVASLASPSDVID